MRKPSIFLFALFFFAPVLWGQILINEINPRAAELTGIEETSDWIELYNSGSSVVQLSGYSLSDDAIVLDKWIFPSATINPDEHLLVLANDNGTAEAVTFDAVVVPSDTWRYTLGNAAIPEDWDSTAFDDSGWMTGIGGFGYADEDDGTQIPTGTASVFMRTTFDLDISEIVGLALHMDYDDGFIAYLNGVEISRSDNMIGHSGDYDDFSIFEHEASLSDGDLPEVYPIVNTGDALRDGENLLAIQVHNNSDSSSDFSSNVYLIVEKPVSSGGDLPEWFVNENTFLQTSFKLSSEGETLLLSDATGTIVDEVTYPEMKFGHSYGRATDGAADWCIHTSPSPIFSNQLSNTACADAYASLPIITPDAGYYDGAIDVSINCPDGTAHYTTNGAPPNNDSAVGTSVSIEQTEVLSVVCYSDDAPPSDIETATYLVEEERVDMPVISISTAFENLWDNEMGIHVFGDTFEEAYPHFGANFWQNWERDAVIEYFPVDQSRAFSLPIALEIHGGWSRAEPQKGLRIDSKKDLGGFMEYPLFSEKNEIEVYNNFNLRNGGQHAHGNRYQDAFVSRLVAKNTAIDIMAYEPVAVYLNAEFWGLFGQREKMDEHYVESNHGVSSKNVDLISKDIAQAGTTAHFLETLSLSEQINEDTDVYYDTIAERIDLENYIDYYATEIHVQNMDWAGIAWEVNNIKCWRPQTADGKWRYMLFDVDAALGNFGGNVNENYLNFVRNQGLNNWHSEMFDNLMKNEKIRLQFINRYADLINTVFQPEFYDPISDELRGELVNDIDKQINRWSAPANFSNWQEGINDMINHLDAREHTARNHIRSHFNLEAQRTLTLRVEPAEAGRIQINTIEPETSPWEGVYFQGAPVTITAIANPGYTFENWDDNATNFDPGLQSFTVDPTSNANFVARFSGSAEVADVVISEINYHSSEDSDSGDWFELHNGSDFEIDVSNWKFQDSQFYNTYNIPAGTRIPANGFLVIAQDLELFQSVYPSFDEVIGGFDFNLSNKGEEISLADNSGELQTKFIYQDDSPWSTNADGLGYTLELIAHDADPGVFSSWESNCPRGTPGFGFGTPCFAGINDRTQAVLSVSPNPATEEVWINFDSSFSGKYSLVLQNELGQQTQLPSRFLENGSRISLPELASGIYLLTLKSSEEVLTTKLVIE